MAAAECSTLAAPSLSTDPVIEMSTDPVIEMSTDPVIEMSTDSGKVVVQESTVIEEDEDGKCLKQIN